MEEGKANQSKLIATLSTLSIVAGYLCSFRREGTSNGREVVKVPVSLLVALGKIIMICIVDLTKAIWGTS